MSKLFQSHYYLCLFWLRDAAEIQRSACITIWRYRWQWGQNITLFMSDMCLFQTISCKYKKTDSIITVKIAPNVLVILLSYSSNKACEVFQIIFYPVRLNILLQSVFLPLKWHLKSDALCVIEERLKVDPIHCLSNLYHTASPGDSVQ